MAELSELGNYFKKIARDAGTSLITKGANALDFNDERQVAISQEAVELTNYMVDNGLIGKQYRVDLLVPEDASERTRANTGIIGDEEVFNAVNHALLSYYAGQHPLSGLGVQAKEMIQGMQVKSRGGNPNTEGLDFFNNKFGLNLARQGATLDEAKSAIVNSIGNMNDPSAGTRGRMLGGLPLRAGSDLLLNRNDLPKDQMYPFRK